MGIIDYQANESYFSIIFFLQCKKIFNKFPANTCLIDAYIEAQVC